MRQQFHYQPATGVEALIRDFQSETGITLIWHTDSELHEDETPYGYGDNVFFDVKTWREGFAVIDSFYFNVPGAVVSANMPKRTTYGSVDVSNDEILSADETALLEAIKSVCGFDPMLHVIID